MFCEDTGKILILEINSTPCLTDDHSNTIDKYVRGLGALVGVLAPVKKKAVKPVAQPKKISHLLASVGV